MDVRFVGSLGLNVGMGVPKLSIGKLMVKRVVSMYSCFTKNMFALFREPRMTGFDCASMIVMSRCIDVVDFVAS